MEAVYWPRKVTLDDPLLIIMSDSCVVGKVFSLLLVHLCTRSSSPFCFASVTTT